MQNSYLFGRTNETGGQRHFQYEVSETLQTKGFSDY